MTRLEYSLCVFGAQGQLLVNFANYQVSNTTQKLEIIDNIYAFVRKRAVSNLIIIGDRAS